MTALMYAAQSGNVEAVNLLISQYNADITIQSYVSWCSGGPNLRLLARIFVMPQNPYKHMTFPSTTALPYACRPA